MGIGNVRFGDEVDPYQGTSSMEKTPKGSILPWEKMMGNRYILPNLEPHLISSALEAWNKVAKHHSASFSLALLNFTMPKTVLFSFSSFLSPSHLLPIHKKIVFL